MTKLKATMIALTAALSIGTAAIYAQETVGRPYPYGMGPGMMSGYGGGMMGGYGMGPGMMGGYGRGYGMGPGTMGGYGMGPGMMGGHGVGGAALFSLDLTPEQRKQVVSIQDQVRKSNWDLMGKMQDEMAKQRDAFAETGKRDRAAIAAANKRMFELRQQMLDNAFDAGEKIEKVLTPQQREQLKKQWGPAWMMGFDE
ncbi:MAG TPA: Spy/CpxP family protein refolding chaperone [Burkholderiaceae bacterium]|nr:Spy/CpxP family protein refolding chaperone [Burkholderiaceae bacterium]